MEHIASILMVVIALLLIYIKYRRDEIEGLKFSHKQEILDSLFLVHGYKQENDALRSMLSRSKVENVRLLQCKSDLEERLYYSEAAFTHFVSDLYRGHPELIQETNQPEKNGNSEQVPAGQQGK
jgi:hypothetical protein